MLGRIRAKWRAMPEPPAKVVLARQADGLGERLNALLNAMRLADLLAVDYRFTWPMGLSKDPHHAIVPAEEVFSARFLAAHLIDKDDAKDGFELLAGPADDLRSVRAQLAAARRGVRVQARPLSTRIDPDAVPAVRAGFAAEFARVGFHPRIDDAIAAARALPLGAKPVGIHLRAGDNLFGRYRTWTRYAYKVVPVPVARALVERFRGEGREVLIFGQDDELIAELCENSGAIDASTLRPSGDLSRPVEALFDLVLLSRCEPIISGFSGFAIQAASIADTSVTNHLDMYSPSEVVALTRADLDAHGDRYSSTHRSFAWWSAYYGARHELTQDEAVPMLEAALAADPTNPRARLRLAALHYRDGRPDRGDDELVHALVADVEDGRKTLWSVLLFSLLTVGGYDSEEIFEEFERRAKEGPGPATIYQAARSAERGEADAARKDATAFLSFAASDLRLSGLEDLEDMARKSIELRLNRAGRPA